MGGSTAECSTVSGKTDVRARRPIGIIGQGVIGLTTAARLVDVGYEVVVYSRDSPSEIASTAAGAYWWPHKIDPPERVGGWAGVSLAVYAELAKNPASGVRFHEHRRFQRASDSGEYARELLPETEDLGGGAFGVDCEAAFRCRLPGIDAPTFMRYLKTVLMARGVSFVRREVGSAAELFADHRLVVNCSGLGARELAGDNAVYPIRGQTVRLPLPAGLLVSSRIVDRSDAITVVLPRGFDLLLGGTAQIDDSRLTPDAEDVRGILERCAALVPEIRQLDVLETRVGLRPGRNEVRLELELSEPGRAVVHNYGHGGAGFTVAWGCAEEAAGLARAWHDRGEGGMRDHDELRSPSGRPSR